MKGIIFDFDGVIAQSVQLKTDAFKYLYKPYGEKVVNNVIEHHQKNGGMSRYEKFKYYHKYYLNKKITAQELKLLSKNFSDIVVEKVIHSPYTPGVLNYIKKSYKKYKLFISTGTPTDEMNKILYGRKIIKYFTRVFGAPGEKSSHINEILSKYNFIPEDLIFYGDSNTDLNAAKSTKIPFILVNNRFNKDISNIYEGEKINNFMGLS